MTRTYGAFWKGLTEKSTIFCYFLSAGEIDPVGRLFADNRLLSTRIGCLRKEFWLSFQDYLSGWNCFFKPGETGRGVNLLESFRRNNVFNLFAARDLIKPVNRVFAEVKSLATNIVSGALGRTLVRSLAGISESRLTEKFRSFFNSLVPGSWIKKNDFELLKTRRNLIKNYREHRDSLGKLLPDLKKVLGSRGENKTTRFVKSIYKELRREIRATDHSQGRLLLGMSRQLDEIQRSINLMRGEQGKMKNSRGGEGRVPEGGFYDY